MYLCIMFLRIWGQAGGMLFKQTLTPSPARVTHTLFSQPTPYWFFTFEPYYAGNKMCGWFAHT